MNVLDAAGVRQSQKDLLTNAGEVYAPTKKLLFTFMSPFKEVLLGEGLCHSQL